MGHASRRPLLLSRISFSGLAGAPPCPLTVIVLPEGIVQAWPVGVTALVAATIAD